MITPAEIFNEFQSIQHEKKACDVGIDVADNYELTALK